MTAAQLPRLDITRRAAERVRGGHPWVFRDDVSANGTAEPGEPALVVHAGDVLGTALTSTRSTIAARLVADRAIRVDRAFVLDQLRRARDTRARALDGLPEGYRWVHGEADGLPGLVVDRFGDALAVQVLTQGMDRLQETVLSALLELEQPDLVVLRNDAPVRDKEGLPREVRVVVGTARPVVYREGEVSIAIDLVAGQKTGTFLDQRDNHVLAGKLARGEALDVCSGDGGFALQMARGGCTRVLAVDQSAAAVARITANAERNGLPQVEARAGDAFEVVRALLRAGERFDAVVVDPPAFAKGRAAVTGALRGYKDLNLHAMKLLRPGGVLVACSCSQPVTRAMFDQMLTDAAADAGRTLRVLHRRGAGPDHPLRVGFPEGDYLKCVISTVEP